MFILKYSKLQLVAQLVLAPDQVPSDKSVQF